MFSTFDPFVEHAAVLAPNRIHGDLNQRNVSLASQRLLLRITNGVFSHRQEALHSFDRQLFRFRSPFPLFRYLVHRFRLFQLDVYLFAVRLLRLSTLFLPEQDMRTEFLFNIRHYRVVFQILHRQNLDVRFRGR